MNKFFVLATTVIGLGLAPAFAQHGGNSGPNFGGAMGKLFGDNQTFSASIEFQTVANGSDITMPGKLAFDTGKSRFEMNMSEVKGSQMTPQMAAQMKSMGMDAMISISRPDLKMGYIVYPGLNSYAEMAAKDSADSVNPEDYKTEITEIGKETVDGHACVKNKVVVTGKDGVKQESTVWNATDLKKFPVKMITGETGHAATISFKNVSFAKPAAELFVAPTGYTKYENIQAMMQAEMMKKMGGGMGGMPPAQK